MKIITCLFLFCVSSKLSDCTLNSILPFTMGSTNFQVINRMNQIGGFEKKDVTGGIYYKMASTDCYNGINNELLLKFSDDHLYYYEITTDYAMIEYDRMITNYKIIVQKLSSHPTYKIKDKRIISNSDTHEQVGEGYMFKKVKNYGNKPDEIEVSYSIEKSNNSKEDIYQITVSYVNLNGTKLTGEGGY